MIRPGVVLPGLISRRRKEGDQDPASRILLPETLQNRPSLLELAQGGAMHPDKWVFFGGGGEGRGDLAKYVFSAFQPSPGLGIPGGHKEYACPIEPEKNMVKKNTQLHSVFLATVVDKHPLLRL